ncbi:MAG TPA: flagellar assembly protein FliW [candidate division Zixibacteria bacterium]|nr:flagellar assembly protein FliW [candidate division Zixibacteria bacterium]
MDSRKILTQRFGELEVPESRVISMEKPVLGFEGRREFVIVEARDTEPFAWLQSADDPDLAFLVINPSLFFPDYCIDVNRREVADIGVSEDSTLEIFVIVSVGATAEETTVNLQGPIVINTEVCKAKQLVLANSDYRVNQPLYGRSPVERADGATSQRVAARV